MKEQQDSRRKDGHAEVCRLTMSLQVLISKPDIRNNLTYYSKTLKTYSENRNGRMIDVLNWGR